MAYQRRNMRNRKRVQRKRPVRKRVNTRKAYTRRYRKQTAKILAPIFKIKIYSYSINGKFI